MLFGADGETGTSLPLGALAIEITSSKAIAGKEFYPVVVLHHNIFIIAQLWLTFVLPCKSWPDTVCCFRLEHTR